MLLKRYAFDSFETSRLTNQVCVGLIKLMQHF